MNSITRATVALIPLALAGVVALNTPGVAHSEATPTHADCREAGVNPTSDVAKSCRRHGWIVTAKVNVDPQGRAVTGYGKCEEEDSRRCYWNALQRGNGVGHGFVALTGRRVWVDKINGQWATSKRDREHAWVMWPIFDR